MTWKRWTPLEREKYETYIRDDPRWKEVRRRMFLRVQLRLGTPSCERCRTRIDELPGGAKDLHVHHLGYSYLYRELEEWPDSARTLLLACSGCHSYLHGRGPDPMEVDIDAEIQRLLKKL